MGYVLHMLNYDIGGTLRSYLWFWWCHFIQATCTQLLLVVHGLRATSLARKHLWLGHCSEKTPGLAVLSRSCLPNWVEKHVFFLYLFVLLFGVTSGNFKHDMALYATHCLGAWKIAVGASVIGALAGLRQFVHWKPRSAKAVLLFWCCAVCPRPYRSPMYIYMQFLYTVL